MAKSVNPYCDSDPCNCEPVCTCGLKLVGREEEVTWDDDRQMLKFERVERYVRDESAA